MWVDYLLAMQCIPKILTDKPLTVVFLGEVLLFLKQCSESLTVALVYYMQVPRSFSPRKKALGLVWESNQWPHISSVMLYQLSYQAPWEQGGGEEGIQVLVLGGHYNCSYGTPLGDNAVTSGTRLDALAIRTDSSKIINSSICIEVPRSFSEEKPWDLSWEWTHDFTSPVWRSTNWFIEPLGSKVVGR